MSKDFSQLEKLGFTKQEIDVYISMVSSYHRTLEEVMLGTNLSKEDVSVAIEKLKAQGYCKVIPGKMNQYIALVPNLPITSDAQKKIQEDFKLLETDVNNSWIKAKESLSSFINAFHSDMDEIGQKTKEENKVLSTDTQSSVEDFSNKLKESTSSNLQKIYEEARENLRAKFNSLKETIDGSFSDMLDVSSNESYEMNEKLSEIESTAIKTLVNLKEEQIRTIDGYHGEVSAKIVPASEKILESLSNLKSSADEIFSGLETKVKELTTELNDYTSSQGEEVVDNFSRNSARIEEITQEIQSIINENIENVRISTEKFNENAKDLVKGLIEDHIAKAKKSVIDYREKVNKKLQDMNNQKEGIQRVQNELNNSVVDVKDRIEAEIWKIQDEIAKFIQEDYSNAAIVQEESNQFVVESLETRKDHLLSGLEDISSQLNISLNSHVESINNAITSKEEELRTSLDDQIIKQNEIVKGIHEQVIKNLDENATELITIVDGIKTDLENEIGSKILSSTGNNKSMIEKARNTFEESSVILTRQLIEQLQSFSGSGQMLLGTMQESISMTMRGHDDEVEKSLTDSRDKMITQSANLIQSANENLKTTNEFLGDVFNTQIDTLKVLQSEIVGTLSTKIDAKTNDVRTSLTDLSQEIDEKNTKILRDIPDALELFKTDHNAKLEQFEREIRGNLSRLINLVEELHEALNVKKFKDKERKIFTEKLEEARTELEPAMSKFTNLIRDQAEVFSNEIDDHLGNFISTLQILNDDSKTSLMNNIGEFSSSVENLKTEINSSVSKTFSGSVNLLEEKRDNSTEQIGELDQSITASINSVKDQFSVITSDLIEKSKDTSENVLNDVETYVTGLLSAYASVSEQASDETNETMSTNTTNILGALDNAIKSTDEAFKGIEIDLVDSVTSRNEKISSLLTNVVDNLKEKTTTIENDLKNEIVSSINSLNEEVNKTF
ncbi:MAG: apolipoprotein A-IV repeat region-like domain-containing protein, partial [Candidatus Hodarchaeales archaeon]